MKLFTVRVGRWSCRRPAPEDKTAMLCWNECVVLPAEEGAVGCKSDVGNLSSQSVHSRFKESLPRIKHTNPTFPLTIKNETIKSRLYLLYLKNLSQKLKPWRHKRWINFVLLIRDHDFGGGRRLWEVNSCLLTKGQGKICFLYHKLWF